MQPTHCLIHLLFYPLDELPVCMLSSIYFTFLVENMKIAVRKNCTTDFTDTDCTDIQLLYFSNRHVILLLLFSHSVMSDSATMWTAARQASLSFKISQSLLKLIY